MVMPRMDLEHRNRVNHPTSYSWSSDQNLVMRTKRHRLVGYIVHSVPLGF